MKAFQTTIAKNPTDVTTRLVYSDWLEENGLLWEASYQRWAAFTIERGAWPPVKVLTTVPVLHFSDLVQIKLDKLPPVIAHLFRTQWQTRGLLAPWEIEKTLCEAFRRTQFLFTREQHDPGQQSNSSPPQSSERGALAPC